MRAVLAALPVSLVICVSAVPAAPAKDAAVRTALQARYDMLARAFRKKDSRALMAGLTGDFTEKRDGQTLSRKQWEAEIAQILAGTRSVSRMAFKIDRLTVKGASAVAVAKLSLARSVTTPEGPRSQSLTRTSRDTWVKTSAGWRLKRMEVLSSKSE
jgi:hypothetical protein